MGSQVLGAASGALGGAAAGSAFGPVGSIVGGVLGGLGGLFGSGVDEAAIQAKRDAGLESARRAALGHDLLLSESRARAAASGTETWSPTGGAGSMQTYLATMAAEFRRQNDWNVMQANRAADLAEDSLTFNQLSGVASGLFQFGAANNWFRQPTVTPAATPTYTPGFGQPLWR